MKPQSISTSMARTAFHTRTAAANRLNRWHSWKGYTSSDAYFDTDLEYFACRNASAVFDLCPMSKYRISGPDAADYLNRLVTRDLSKLSAGTVAYVVWCNDDGKVIDDGTVFHLAPGEYRLCAYNRHLAWLKASAIGFDVDIFDETDLCAALALQGPTSCEVLRQLGLPDIGSLKPFKLAFFEFAGAELMVSRTGFTGDLGYELWITPTLALTLWDSLFEAGRLLGIQPMGGEALEMARIEAGFIQAGVDFLPADRTVRPGRGRSPYELGLDWLVSFDKPVFTGMRALRAEKENGSSAWRLLKLDVDGNKAATSSYIYSARKKQVGFVTSAMWSPVAKKNIALANVKASAADTGETLFAEIYYQRELHWSRVMVEARAVSDPFWNPPRKRLTPPEKF